MTDFPQRRRQKYIDYASYESTLRHYESISGTYDERLGQAEVHPGDHIRLMNLRAMDTWEAFQLRYTGGDTPQELAILLGKVVSAFDDYVQKNNEASDKDYRPPFMIAQYADIYLDYLNIVCAAILLHREDLLPTIFSWNEGTDFDGVDAILEELFKFYFPDRPELDEWLWDTPYRLLLDVLDEEDTSKRPVLMKKYLKKWYSSFKGKAHFWGSHEKITPEFSPYFGYWAMCAGAFTYLYDIDDISYRNEEVYPKDLVDYARSIPRRAVSFEHGETILRVLGGQKCPKKGYWFSPAKSDSLSYYDEGELMPNFDQAQYGETIWQWSAEA